MIIESEALALKMSENSCAQNVGIFSLLGLEGGHMIRQVWHGLDLRWHGVTLPQGQSPWLNSLRAIGTRVFSETLQV